MNSRGTVRLATRGSALARQQAASVKEALERRRTEVELVEVETRGDQLQDELIHRLGKTGAFVRALDEQVLDGTVDGAVHSMKDMPTEAPPDLVVAGVPERGPATDRLVTPDGTPFEDLPSGATVGTSSLRRKAQLLKVRPDLDVVPLRGNVDTRIEKLLAPTLQRTHESLLDADDDEGTAEASEWFEARSELERQALGREVDTEFDAIVLAEAGLERSGLLDAVKTVRLPRGTFVPAPGQGAIAVTARSNGAAEGLHNVLDHPPTRVATTVERTILRELNGGCVAPIGVNAMVQGEYVHVDVQVLSTDGSEAVEASRDLPVTNHADAAVEFAATLRERGAADLVAAARTEAGDSTTTEE